MTREEAVTRIKDHIEIHRYHERNAVKIFEALDMAIKALSEPEIIRCKDCIHRPIVNDPLAINGFGIRFPDFRCPCRCDDGYYSRMPNDNWFCGNGEKEEKTNEIVGR